MLTRRIVPCLDVRAGRIVKGVRFANLRDAGDPAARAALYESQGADEIVVLDISATQEERSAAVATIQSVRAAISIPLTVGGGVRGPEWASALLGAGADKVGVNTAAVEQPELVRECAELFGRQCVVVAIDAAKPEGGGGWEVVVRSGSVRTGLDAINWARQVEDLGAGEILLTSWDRDGAQSGYDLALLCAIRAAVSIPVIASGGAGTVTHMLDAFRAGADAALAASIFHDGNTTIQEVKAALAAQGERMRTC
jgi:imidazoleglycerol phosphate synthase cyclase subunit